MDNLDLGDLIPHQLKLTPSQAKKLLSGVATKIAHSSLGADKGDQVIHLLGDNASKMIKAYSAGRGLTLTMRHPEIQHTIHHGQGIDINKILNSPVGKKLTDKAIDVAIDRMLGGKAGVLDGINKVLASPVVQKLGDKALDKAIDRAFSGGKVMKGSEEAKEKMAKLRAMRKGAGHYENLLKVQQGLRTIGKPFERTVGVNPADIGEPIGEAIGAELYKAVHGHPRGYGISRVVYDAIPKGKGVKQSKAYQTAMKSQVGFVPDVPTSKSEPVSKFSVDKRVKPSGDQMTLSPYQAPSAPAMNPFVPKHYTQEGGTQSGYGGRGLYAGKGLF
jgi:hypothetical protein